ncbi:unnamed protein product [Paramecium sonneborni]|uniref:Uncharacterized protein n=1 Tax=Paramecium sonneborni TaxID=65129 RepID=A0A8S1RTT7_9CILI|nr:unnamed protein product [Paramecium sonneborni]
MIRQQTMTDPQFDEMIRNYEIKESRRKREEKQDLQNIIKIFILMEESNYNIIREDSLPSKRLKNINLNFLVHYNHLIIHLLIKCYLGIQMNIQLRLKIQVEITNYHFKDMHLKLVLQEKQKHVYKNNLLQLNQGLWVQIIQMNRQRRDHLQEENLWDYNLIEISKYQQD